MEILGIDVGGSGIKGAPVNTETGMILVDRYRIKTPEGAETGPVAETIARIAHHFSWTGPIGVGFPAPIKHGVVKMAANISSAWVGVNADELLSQATGCPVTVINDADAAALAEAGYPDGFEFEWTASPNESWGIPIVEATIPMLAKVGIKVKVKPVEGSALGGIVAKGDFQAYIWSNTSGPDPLTQMKCFHSKTPRSACNYTTFSNAEVDKLIDEAGATDDLTKRNDLLKKANAVLYEEAPVWFFNYNKAVLAYQPWLHGLQPNATELALQYYEDLWVDETSPAAK